MNKRQQLNVLQSELDESNIIFEKASKKYYHDKEDLDEKRRQIIVQIIEEENLLNLTSWELSLSTSEEIYLTAELTSNDKKIKKLVELTSSGYHSSFPLKVNSDDLKTFGYTSEISLNYNDSEINIGFDNHINISEFIAKYKLKITNNKLQEKLDKINKIKLQLENIIKLS